MPVTYDATKQKIAELRHMAGRTGNKSAENTMRSAADYLEAMNKEYLKMAEDHDKLRQKLADMKELLAGWKSLLDANTAILAAATSQQTATDTESDPKNSTDISRRKPFDYCAVLVDFMQSGLSTKCIQTEPRNPASPHAGNRYPDAGVFRKTIHRLNLPVTARQLGDVIVFQRRDTDVP